MEIECPTKISDLNFPSNELFPYNHALKLRIVLQFDQSTLEYNNFVKISIPRKNR